jgi:hypothetical protein
VANNNLLDEIFDAKEEDVETFADTINMGEHKFAAKEIARVKKTSEFRTSRQKNVEITCGYHESDYVWHIKPWHPKKPWAVSIDRVVYAIAKILHSLIPHDIQIDTFLPESTWEIKEITIKAYGAMNHWSLREEDFQKVTGQMFEILNTLT